MSNPKSRSGQSRTAAITVNTRATVPDADGERQQALLRRADELTERRLHALRQLRARCLGPGDDLDSL